MHHGSAGLFHHQRLQHVGHVVELQQQRLHRAVER